jgi:putative membrane protein
MMGMGTIAALLMLCGGVLVLVLLGAAVWLVVRSSGARDDQGSPDRMRRDGPGSALEILQRRYAAGEIDEDEYFRRSSGLQA